MNYSMALDLRTGNGDWKENRVCPSCGGGGGATAKLAAQKFYFGGAAVETPPQPILLMSCQDCGLIFKNVVASEDYLRRLTATTEDSIWIDDYGYRPEIELIRTILGKDDFDILDVGAAGGGLLKAIGNGGRRSALDVVAFGRLETDGEFIQGFLETPGISWSGTPYDVVTVFDVFEHLYDPVQAMSNIISFLKEDGIVIIETGNADVVPQSRLGRWAYLNYIQHHIAWNRHSIEHLVGRCGFRILSFEEKPHKLRMNAPFDVKGQLKHLAFSAAPALYAGMFRLLGRPFNAPGNPRQNDHFRVVLQRAGDPARA